MTDEATSRGARIVITCAGRAPLVADLLTAAPNLDRLVAVDADPEAAVRYAVDHFETVPRVDDDPDRYIDALLDLCREHAADCVVPLLHIDVPTLAARRRSFDEHGVRVATAPPPLVEILRDKRTTTAWLEARELPAVPILEPDRLEPDDFPVVVKPAVGAGAQRLFHVDRPDELPRRDELEARDAIVQPQLTGPEYNLQVLRDPDSAVVSVVPSRKLEMRWGSTHRAETVDDPELVRLGARVGEEVGHLGVLDLDVIEDAHGERYILDVNPRPGAGCGVPAAARADANFVESFLEIAAGRRVSRRLGDHTAGVRIDRQFRWIVRTDPGREG